MLPIRTVKDALQDLEGVEPTSGCGLVQLPNGGIIKNHTHNPTDYIESDQLKADKPAATILTKRAITHYMHKRPLTIREFARYA